MGYQDLNGKSYIIYSSPLNKTGEIGWQAATEQHKPFVG